MTLSKILRPFYLSETVYDLEDVSRNNQNGLKTIDLFAL